MKYDRQLIMGTVLDQYIDKNAMIVNCDCKVFNTSDKPVSVCFINSIIEAKVDKPTEFYLDKFRRSQERVYITVYPESDNSPKYSFHKPVMLGLKMLY